MIWIKFPSDHINSILKNHEFRVSVLSNDGFSIYINLVIMIVRC